MNKRRIITVGSIALVAGYLAGIATGNYLKTYERMTLNNEYHMIQEPHNFFFPFSSIKLARFTDKKGVVTGYDAKEYVPFERYISVTDGEGVGDLDGLVDSVCFSRKFPMTCIYRKTDFEIHKDIFLEGDELLKKAKKRFAGRLIKRI